MSAVLEKYLIKEINRCTREIRQLEQEIEAYERMLKKLRRENRATVVAER